MSDSRRRSTRRGKKCSVYSLNDLVQIPHNSTNLVGRLAYKIMEQPSVRWLVAFDEQNRKDEEIAEEALGPVIGCVTPIIKTCPDSATKNDTIIGNILTTTTISKDTTITTRSLRKKSCSGSSNSSSSAEDSGTKIGINKKKKEDTHQTFERSVIEKQPLNSAVQKESIPITRILTAIRTSSHKAKVTDREQRSRRRRALSIDEMSSPATAANKIPVPAVGTNYGSTSLQNKRSIAQGTTNSNSNDNAKGEYIFRNKKAKVSSIVSNPRAHTKKEVLKVQLLTGTLYLYSKEKVEWRFTS